MCVGYTSLVKTGGHDPSPLHFLKDLVGLEVEAFAAMVWYL